jgi:hypothetical protein
MHRMAPSLPRAVIFVSGGKRMVWNILALLLTLWLLLLILHVGKGLTDLLPLAAFLVLIANVLAASRTVA